jgi:hypothetical protein
MKNIDKFGYLIVSIVWIIYTISISMLEKNAHIPIQDLVLICFGLIVLGCGVYWFTLKRSNALIALAAGIFWPLVAVFFLLKYLSTFVKTPSEQATCRNCGHKIGLLNGKANMGFFALNPCTKQGKNCVPL